ncbi:MAG TPA: hypothetical protein VNF91_03235, partial [Candidatus Acidoferrum sp.]|nr:hypothetical protein [Candidatus Acidoferrum sp.]
PRDCVYTRDMRAGWITVIGLVSACSKPHVMLPAVTPNMTPEQRVQMFQDLYATREHTRTTTICGGRGGCSTSVEKTLYLANGTQIYHPEDLLPVVEPDSTTARAVRDVHVQRRKALAYGGLSLVSLVGFIAIGFTKVEAGGTSFSTAEKVGLLATIGGLLVGGFGAWYHNNQAAESWGEANESYNASLAQRLDVCTSGFAVVPCESPPAPATPPTRAMPPMPRRTPAPALAPPGVTRPVGR